MCYIFIYIYLCYQLPITTLTCKQIKSYRWEIWQTKLDSGQNKTFHVLNPILFGEEGGSKNAPPYALFFFLNISKTTY